MTNAVIEFKDAWAKSSIREVVAHIPFLVNLAIPNEELIGKSIRELQERKEIIKESRPVIMDNFFKLLIF